MAIYCLQPIINCSAKLSNGAALARTARLIILEVRCLPNSAFSANQRRWRNGTRSTCLNALAAVGFYISILVEEVLPDRTLYLRHSLVYSVLISKRPAPVQQCSPLRSSRLLLFSSSLCSEVFLGSPMVSLTSLPHPRSRLRRPWSGSAGWTRAWTYCRPNRASSSSRMATVRSWGRCQGLPWTCTLPARKSRGDGWRPFYPVKSSSSQPRTMLCLWSIRIHRPASAIQF